ncbi:histidine phosphatase family protein [uncultured Olleya sp.]|uniref:SixA phosphatase family protein n=1 Tax=uncultured Olleya sp. TaxID=757243 RepID=UPI0025932ED8|nr:histidine phosphatase family protein [uncultured Olleya sp.]
MNKKIQFIRHAKSSWKYDVSDKERPLKKRGVNDVVLMCKHLKTKILKPEAIFSSPANRTKSTAMLFVDNLKFNSIKIEYKNELYDFSGESVLSVLKSCDNSINTLMLFGHNYALTNLCNSLGDISIDNVTTSGFVEIEFKQSSWKDIKNGKTTKIVFPKHLK